MLCKAYNIYNKQLTQNTKFLNDPPKYINSVLNKLKELTKQNKILLMSKTRM